MIKQAIEQSIKDAFQKSFNFKPESLDITNPENMFGDFALACHKFAKELKKSPQDIAQKLADNIKSDLIIKSEAVSGYINITIDTGKLGSEVLEEVIKQGKKYGYQKNKDRKVTIEYSQPNTNKPMHLGHIRNNLLGMSVDHLIDATGGKVFKTDIVNDRGIHITKSMVAYQRYGNGKTPEQVGEKGDHFVGKFYVRFEQEFEKEWKEYLEQNPEATSSDDQDYAKKRQEFFGRSLIGREAQQMLLKWEANDKKIKKLWKQMNAWVYSGFKETYKNLGSEFDKKYYESDTYLLGKKVIESGLKSGDFFKKEDGSIWVDLTDVGLDQKLLLRGDGTSVYITQDLGLAIERNKEVAFDYMMYIVGHEQEYHFKVLFEILKKLGYKWADNLHHLSYGLVFLPEGKMKSRVGKVVDADTIIEEVTELAREEIKKRDSQISDREIEKRAEIIGMGALKFFLLRVTPTQSIHFNPKEAISFEGSTGPYVQYAHARISSILKGESAPNPRKIDFDLLDTPEEKAVIIKLLQYPEMLKEASAHHNPSSVCNYLIELAHLFNSFYHEHSVLKADSEEVKKVRLVLIKSVQIVLKNGLEILGIKAPEKM